MELCRTSHERFPPSQPNTDAEPYPALATRSGDFGPNPAIDNERKGCPTRGLRVADWPNADGVGDVILVVKRLVAFLFAVGAIAGAFAFRDWRDAGGSLGSAALPVVCDDAIAEACRDAFDDVRLAAPGVTLDQLLTETDPEPFVWVAADIWFDMIEDARTRGVPSPSIGERSDGLAHAPLVFAGPGVDGCDPPSFSCLAGRDVDADIGIEDRDDSSAGLLAFGQLAFLRNQQSNTNLRWSERDGAELADADTRTLLNYQNAAGRFDLVIVSAAAFDTLGPNDVAVAPADVPVAVTIGAAVIGGDGDLPDLDDLTAALTSEEWVPGAAPSFDGPSAGGLIGLRNS